MNCCLTISRNRKQYPFPNMSTGHRPVNLLKTIATEFRVNECLNRFLYRPYYQTIESFFRFQFIKARLISCTHPLNNRLKIQLHYLKTSASSIKISSLQIELLPSFFDSAPRTVIVFFLLFFKIHFKKHWQLLCKKSLNSDSSLLGVSNWIKFFKHH